MSLRMHFYGDPILRKRCEPVEKVTPEIKEFVAQMIEMMDSYRGIGLAANQVGKLLRIFVVREEKILPDGRFTLGDVKVYINPKLSSPGEESMVMPEGCLSFPGLHVEVDRPLSITVEYMDLEGKTHKETINGYDARVIMHENDHLNGIFHVDRADKNERKHLDPLLRNLKKKYKHTYS